MDGNNSLTNQVVVITGCSTGIGNALVQEFRNKGHRTFATARRTESVEQLQAQGLETLQLDVTQPEAIERAISAVMDKAGRIDMLVNNAGYNLFGPLAEAPIDKFRALMETNLVAPLALIQRVFPIMAQQRSGRIINIGSVVGVVPTPYAGSYCASKAALHMLSEVLRMESAPFGIQVVEVQPGGVRSNIAATGSKGLERYNSKDSLYQPVYSQIEKRANASQDNPMEAEEFAQKLVREITQKQAPRIVRLGTGADFLIELSKLPGEELDKAMTAQFGLDLLYK